MTLGLDTDVAVNLLFEGASAHRRVRDFLHKWSRTHSFGLAPQVIFEFLHVVTDPKRFETPLPMTEALERARELWRGAEIVRVMPTSQTVMRVFELMTSLGLGRKRILDTALAATYEAAGILSIATLNRRDFQVFDFVETVDPLA